MINNGEDYDNQVFEDLEMIGKVISEVRFDDCTFKNCKFNETIFEECRFIDCVFEGCDLSMMKLDKCNIHDIKIIDTKAIGIDWSTVTGNFDVSLIENSKIDMSCFTGLNLKKCSIINCSALDVDFENANLESSYFKGTDLTGSIFINTNLVKANFEEAHNYKINPFSNNIKGLKVSYDEALSFLGMLGIKIKK